MADSREGEARAAAGAPSGRRAESGRVVVSGMGAVSAAGLGARELWRAARDGASQVRELRTEIPYDGRIKLAAQVPLFEPSAHIEAEVLPFCDPFTQYAVIAADEAMAQAGLGRGDFAGPRTAVIIGTGIGGMNTIDRGLYRYYVQSIRPDPLTVPRIIPSTAATTLGMRYSCLGPTFAVGSACASASQSIGLGLQMIRFGLADRAIVGGSEACVVNGSMRSWEALRVLTPDLCRPFSKGRNGMTLGEGGAVFILETLESALARGHRPLCELVGYGTSSDAKDPVRPDVVGASSAIALALDDAGMSPRDIHYINAHGTATHANDITESEAILTVFGDDAWPRGSRFLDEARAWPCARRRRRTGARDHDFRAARTDRAADDQFPRRGPPLSDQRRAQCRARDADQGGHVQFLRLRRHQRRADRAGARS